MEKIEIGGGDNTKMSRKWLIIILSASLLLSLAYIGWQQFEAYKVKIYNQGAQDMQAAIGNNIVNQIKNTGQLVVETPEGQVILKKQ
jgi:hypothetical protein